MAYTWNRTCEECKEPFDARSPRQKQCDPCWGKMMGAVRVEYHKSSKWGNIRKAIIVCYECGNEYAQRLQGQPQKRPGLCPACSHRTPEFRAKQSAAQRGKKQTPEQCAKKSAAQLGKKHGPRSQEARANMSAGQRKAQARRKRRGIAQGGKYGWIYVVSGPGQVKVGGSMDEKTLARRLSDHEKKGLTEVHATWQVDPKRGSAIEAAAVAVVLAEWDQVGTTILPNGGTETVWCDDPAAIVALVESVISQEQ